MYPESILRPLYRNALSLTKGRGEHTLAKIDSFLFKYKRQITINGAQQVKFIIPPDSHFFRYLIKTHEPHVEQAISKLAKPGDIVIDVGANIGYFSAYAASAVGKKGQVFCFEPENSNFAILQSNCESYNREGYNCSAYKLALSSHPGVATLNIHRHSTYHSLDDEHHILDKVEAQQTVETTTLDSWIENHNIKEISFLKLDTEGHEAKVLEGANKLFQTQKIKYTLLECRSDHLANFIDNFCQQHNLYQLVWDGNNWHQSNLSRIKNQTECLLSVQSLSPEILW